jgi:hypothetical protein
VAFDGFEDYDFKLAAPVPGACQPARHFDFGLIFNTSNGAWSSPNGSLSSTYAHTGKWSLNLTSPATFTRPMGSSSPIVPFLGYDNLGRYQRLNNEMASGFAPVTDKEYLLSLWVHEDDDANPVNTVQKLTVKLNGNTLTPTGSPARVEGWKRLEVKIPKFSSFQLELVPSGSVYVDDIRIMPLDGQIGTYVYDATTLRLAAQLDENNFATFYEYDAEGTPVRVKKETERGIMTLKENRQSYKTH